MTRVAETARQLPGGCILGAKVCCVGLLLVSAVCFIISFGAELTDAWYYSPEFNLTSLKLSPPSSLVLGDKVVVAGWVACFSTRNPNPEPISYHGITVLLRDHQADVAAFKQAPAVARVVCASFLGDTVIEMESDDKTVWFNAVRLNAQTTYKIIDRRSLHVVCKDVEVVVDRKETAVATELLGGPQECRVKRDVKVVWLVFYFIAAMGALVAFCKCVLWCFLIRP